jgi:hypothetical protein
VPRITANVESLSERLPLTLTRSLVAGDSLSRMMPAAMLLPKKRFF